jgi:LysM repeat protein
VVQEGDTVSEIAEKFGVCWLDIAADNQLEDVNVIKVGQKLIIPSQGRRALTTCVRGRHVRTISSIVGSTMVVSRR